jgi:retinol dehydrogenase 13
VRNWLLKTPKAGAQTSIHLAVDPQYEGISGKYFIECKEAYVSPQARSIETAEWLWKISEEYTGLTQTNSIVVEV